MKKYLSLIIILFVLVSALTYQWFRTGESVARLDVRIHKLAKELVMLKKVKKGGITAFDEKVAEAVNMVDGVRKRLPFILDEYTFADKLTERFRKKNIEVEYFYSFWKNTVFYQQADLVFSFDFQDYNKATFQEIFDSFDRLVHWSVVPQDQTLLVNIYSLSFDFTPNVTSCSVTTEKKLKYWPFNSLLEDRMKLIGEKCRERNESEWLLRKIKYHENIHKYLNISFSILQQLDPDRKPIEKSKAGSEPGQVKEGSISAKNY